MCDNRKDGQEALPLAEQVGQVAGALLDLLARLAEEAAEDEDDETVWVGAREFYRAMADFSVLASHVADGFVFHYPFLSPTPEMDAFVGGLQASADAARQLGYRARWLWRLPAVAPRRRAGWSEDDARALLGARAEAERMLGRFLDLRVRPRNDVEEQVFDAMHVVAGHMQRELAWGEDLIARIPEWWGRVMERRAREGARHG